MSNLVIADDDLSRYAEAFGENVAIKRKRLKMDQRELAELIGVSEYSISNWERGKRLPRTFELIKMAIALDCTIDELFTFI